MKNTKISLIMLTALLAIQATAHAKDEPKKEPRTWGQAAWDNRYNIAGGAAVAGAGVAGYVFRNELMDIYNNMSPAQQEQVKADVQESINNDLQVIAEKQAVVAEQTAELKGMTEVKKHTAAEQKDIAQKEAMVVQKLQETAKIEKQINNKQGWWEWLTDPVRRANDPALKRIQAEINAHNNDWAEFQNEQEPRQMSDEEVLQQNEAIKAAYIAKYGNESGVRRFNKDKDASNYVGTTAFVTSLGAVVAPVSTAIAVAAIHDPTESIGFKGGRSVSMMKPDYASANNYAQMKQQVQNPNQSIEKGKRYASENPANLSSDMRDDDADRAQYAQDQIRVDEKYRRRQPMRDKYKEEKGKIKLNNSLQSLGESVVLLNDVIRTSENNSDQWNKLGDIAYKTFINNPELSKNMSELESKYNNQFTASDNQVDKEFNEESPRTWLSYANPLSPLRNNEPTSNDSQSPIDSQAAKDLQGLV